MSNETLASICLVLSIALSWPRFTETFRSGAVLTRTAAPLTMIASTVSLFAFGLAFSSHDLRTAVLIVASGSLIGIAAANLPSTVPVALSAASLALYLHLSPMVLA